MNALMRSGTATLVISMFLTASLTQAFTPEGASFANPGPPTDGSWIFRGPLGQISFAAATQDADCNRAGTDSPAPLDDATWLVSGYGKLNFALGNESGDFHISYDSKLKWGRSGAESRGSLWDSEGPGYLYYGGLSHVFGELMLGAKAQYDGEGGFELAPRVGLQLEPDPSKLELYVPPRLYVVLPTGIDWSFQDPNSEASDEGSGEDPIRGTFGYDGHTQFQLRSGFAWNIGGSDAMSDALNFTVPRRSYGSITVEAPARDLHYSVSRFSRNELTIGDRQFTTLNFEDLKLGLVYNTLYVTEFVFENDWCRIVLTPTDPNYKRTGRHGGGSWGQPMDDQWAIKRVGYTADESSAWNQVPDTAAPVVVAVIDTGLDWHHLDISYENIWRNEDEIPDNGIDDDANGFVDDIIGWDFFGRHNKPWDFDGHGTLVGGIIAASQNNDAGIAGINPHAKLMVLKAVNNFGTTRASYLAEAIVYAADNGARIINISVGGPHTSRIEQAALDYAHEKGVLVVVASGNEGIELEDYGPAGAEHVLTVGATHTDDRAAAFSNFGDRVDLVAPGVDVLSLRARYTDANYRGTEEYEIGTNYVGEDKRYLHVSGTSFSAPIVTGTASLLLARSPELTVGDVERILYQTAEDIEFPGKDKYAGFGMLDARTALSVDPEFFVTAAIDRVQSVQVEGGGSRLRISGTADAEIFKRAWLQIGAGENPAGWKSVGRKLKFPVRDGTLGSISLREFRGSELWQLVVNVEHKNGTVKRAVYPVRLK